MLGHTMIGHTKQLIASPLGLLSPLRSVALGIVVYVALRSRTRPVDLEKAVQAFRSLDIEAFRNLVDSQTRKHFFAKFVAQKVPRD
jgi:hypothetical protein